MSASIDVSVVVPLFNEASTLRELVDRISQVLTARGGSFEIILVDDGSRDDTAAILDDLEATNPAVRAFGFSRNFGQDAALCCGLFESRGEIVVTMDGDLQNPPEEIPHLLDTFAPGIDLVNARRDRRHEGPLRRAGARFVHWLARTMIGVALDDYGGQFKAYRREVVDGTRSVWAPGKPFFVLAVSLGFPVTEVSVEHGPRSVGESRYRLPALVRINLDLITSFTTVPLALLGAFALLFLGVGAVGIVAVLATGQSSGFAAAAALVTFALGGVFTASAVLGLYLARLYRTVTTRENGYLLRRRPAADREPQG